MSSVPDLCLDPVVVVLFGDPFDFDFDFDVDFEDVALDAELVADFKAGFWVDFNDLELDALVVAEVLLVMAF